MIEDDSPPDGTLSWILEPSENFSVIPKSFGPNAPTGYNSTIDKDSIFSPDFMHRCIQHDYFKLALSSKLWNCEVQLDLFPPLPESDPIYLWKNIYKNVYVEDFQYPEVWLDLKKIRGDYSEVLRKALPSQIPVRKIFLILEPENIMEPKLRQHILRWILQNTRNEDVTAHQELKKEPYAAYSRFLSWKPVIRRKYRLKYYPAS